MAQFVDRQRDLEIHCTFFARAGFTDAARAEAESVGAGRVDLETLGADLGRDLEATTDRAH